MRDIGGGGGSSGGHFVGLQPDAALALASQMTTRGSEGVCSAGRIAGMLEEAGAEAGGCTTPARLRAMNSWLESRATDVRWRVEMVAGGATGGGMRFASLMFPSAAAARADGRRYADEIAAAQQRYFDADSDEERAAAEAAYLDLLRGLDLLADDPAWAGGLIDRIGTDGISNALYIGGGAAQGDVGEMRESLGPLFTALATTMRHRTADPSIRSEILTWENHDLALIVALAPAETRFLSTVARRVLVLSQTDDRIQGDPSHREYELIYGALEDNPEAAFRFLTSKGRFGESVMTYVIPYDLVASPEATRSLGRVLEAGLVEYPAGMGAAEWNRATRATEAVIHEVSFLRNVLDEADPQLTSSLASLLRPHLDAVAVIGARAGGMDAPGGLDVPLPGGRRALDVDVETLRKYLGSVMQSDAGVAHVQLLLAAYAQTPQVQSNRLPHLRLHHTTELDAFRADSARIAGLVGLAGAGLDEAGKDEESVTRLLTGAMNLAAGKGAAKLITSTTPVGWLGRAGAKYLAGEGVEYIEGWLQDREPVEGEVGVTEFVDSYTDTTMASLEEHIANDPELSQMSAGERDALLESVRADVRINVRGQLLETYAELVAETAKE